jgi:hypothetical protein
MINSLHPEVGTLYYRDMKARTSEEGTDVQDVKVIQIWLYKCPGQKSDGKDCNEPLLYPVSAREEEGLLTGEEANHPISCPSCRWNGKAEHAILVHSKTVQWRY